MLVPNHLEIVQYLLTSPELQEHANIHANNNQSLIEACNKGHLDIVRYLLTSPDLKEHADIHAQNDSALRLASEEGHLDIVKYLLTSPDLKEHADIHVDNDKIFKRICSNLKEKTKEIYTYLSNNGYNNIIKMFKKRDLKYKLKKHLKINNNVHHKMKI